MYVYIMITKIWSLLTTFALFCSKRIRARSKKCKHIQLIKDDFCKNNYTGLKKLRFSGKTSTELLLVIKPYLYLHFFWITILCFFPLMYINLRLEQIVYKSNIKHKYSASVNVCVYVCVRACVSCGSSQRLKKYLKREK